MARTPVNYRRLVGLAIITAIAAACTNFPSVIMASAVYTLVWSVLLASILLALLREGRARYFWAGFAVFGLGHQFLAYQGAFRLEHSQLLTSYLIVIVRDLFVEGVPGLANRISLWAAPAGVHPERIFVDIAVSFFSLMVAYVAGRVTQFFFVRRDDRRSQREEVR